MLTDLGGEMRIEVVEINTEQTTRQSWTFQDGLDWYPPCIILDSYSSETKAPRQRKWRVKTYWQRYDKCSNSIENPPVPDWVVTNAKTQMKNRIDDLPLIDR